MSLYDFLPDEYESPYNLNTPQGRRDFIRSTIFNLLDEGISRTQALNIYRNAGAGINSNTFRAIYNEASQFDLYKRIGYLPDYSPITDSVIGYGSRNVDRQYTFKADVTIIDRDTGERLTIPALLDYDTLTSLDDLADLFTEHVMLSSTVFAASVEQVKITNAWSNF